MKTILAALPLAAAVLVTSDAMSRPDERSLPIATHAPSWLDALPADEALSDAQRDAIQHDTRAYAKTATLDEQRALLDRLTRGAPCGRAHAAALAGAMSAGLEPTVVSAALESMHTACDEVLVEGAGFAPNPDATLAETLRRLALNGDDPMRRAAWLSYGSIAETARRRGDAALARAIDVTLAARLNATSGEEHLLFVRAAGNAGCEACEDALAVDAHADDPVLRRAAIAAHRFIEAPDAVARMCGALASDADGAARDLAAWSLEWRTSSGAERTRCLEAAARRDPSKGVRLQAVRALGVLEGDLVEAHDALGRLALLPGDVGALAERTLDVGAAADDGVAMALPSEEGGRR